MAAKCVAPILSLVLIGCTATAEQAVPVARNVASNGLSLDVRPSRVGGDVLIYEVTNRSDGCVAINRLNAPSGGVGYFERVISLRARDGETVTPRIMAQATSVGRQTYLVLPPGKSVTERIDLIAMFGRRQFTNYTLHMALEFFPCTAFTRNDAASRERTTLAIDVAFRPRLAS